jgi:hypothetical protein
MLLEIVDFRISAHPVGFRAETFDTLNQHPAVPCAIVDREATAAR